MKPTYSKKQKNLCLTTIAALSLAATISTAQAASGTSENTKEFLSDPQRVGTITGSILGGVMTAHPAGTIAGSIIGYIVGKQSAFKDPEATKLGKQARYAKRSIIPKTDETILAESTLATEAQTQQPPSTPEQIASYCYGNQGDAINPKLQAMCYYYSRI